MLTLKKCLQILFLFLFILALPLTAQDEDFLEDEGDVVQENVKCEPDSLLTPWDIKYRNNSDVKAKAMTNLSFGKDYFNKKKYDEATPYLWKALVATEEVRFKKYAIRKIVECYYRRGIKMQGEQAVAYLDSALIMAYRGLKLEDGTAFHYWCASIQKLLRRYSCAIPHYQKLVELEAKNKSYWQSLALMFAKVKDAQAIEAQKKVVDLDPNDKEAQTLLERFVVAFGSGNLSDVYKHNYEKNPNDAEVALKYGNELLKSGEFSTAIIVFRKYIKLSPSSNDGYAKLAESYYGNGNTSKAIANYKAFLAKEPSNYVAMVKLGDIYREQESYKTAVNYAYKALRIKGGYGEAYILIATSYRDVVSICSSKREKAGIKYDDKLVYLRAYNILAKAMKDPSSANRAENLRKSLKASIPTKEELFLHKNRKTIKYKCYSWIK